MFKIKRTDGKLRSHRSWWAFTNENEKLTVY